MTLGLYRSWGAMIGLPKRQNESLTVLHLFRKLVLQVGRGQLNLIANLHLKISARF